MRTTHNNVQQEQNDKCIDSTRVPISALSTIICSQNPCGMIAYWHNGLGDLADAVEQAVVADSVIVPESRP